MVATNTYAQSWPRVNFLHLLCRVLFALMVAISRFQFHWVAHAEKALDLHTWTALKTWLHATHPSAHASGENA